MSARPFRNARDRSAPAQRNWFRLGLVVALLLTVLGFTIVVAWRYFDVAEVRLPDVRGLHQDEATRVLRAAELDPVSHAENVPGAEIGEVTSQAPRAGTVVRRGRRVSIGVHTPPEATRAPRLLGLELAEASRLARDANVPITSVGFAASDAAADRIVAQRPEPGTTLAPGEGLELVVSRGAEVPTVALPEVVGLDVEAARARLRSLGFRRVEAVPSSLSFDRPNAVNAQFPPAGDTVPVSTAVTLYFALPGDRIVKVPALEGASLSRAQLLLGAAGLELGEVTFVEDPQAPPGVIGVEPGDFTVRGSPIALTVNGPARPVDRIVRPRGDEAGEGAAGAPGGGGAAGPGVEPLADGARLVPFGFDPAELGVRSLMQQDYQLRLVVADDRGERTVVDRRVAAGESYATRVRVYGDALLQTYINDVFFQAWSP